MVQTICHQCSGNIGQFYRPYYILMEKKRQSGGDMTDNTDVIKKVGIRRECCYIAVSSAWIGPVTLMYLENEMARATGNTSGDIPRIVGKFDTKLQ